jgi:hypothetical protein
MQLLRITSVHYYTITANYLSITTNYYEIITTNYYIWWFYYYVLFRNVIRSNEIITTYYLPRQPGDGGPLYPHFPRYPAAPPLCPLPPLTPTPTVPSSPDISRPSSPDIWPGCLFRTELVTSARFAQVAPEPVLPPGAGRARDQKRRLVWGDVRAPPLHPRRSRSDAPTLPRTHAPTNPHARARSHAQTVTDRHARAHTPLIIVQRLTAARLEYSL